MIPCCTMIMRSGWSRRGRPHPHTHSRSTLVVLNTPQEHPPKRADALILVLTKTAWPSTRLAPPRCGHTAAAPLALLHIGKHEIAGRRSRTSAHLPTRIYVTFGDRPPGYRRPLRATAMLAVLGKVWASFDPTSFAQTAVPALQAMGFAALATAGGIWLTAKQTRPLAPSEEDWACGTYITGH
jgi:hypothetical protein